MLRLPSAKVVVTGIALLVAAVLLYVSLRGVDWHAVYVSILGADPSLVALTLLFSLTALTLRALRWRVLLRAEADVRIADAFWATSSGYFGNNFLPGRAGELLRSYMISSRSRLSGAYVFTTALSERVSDAITLLAISALVIVTLPAPPPWMAAASKPFAIIAVLGILTIVLLPRFEHLVKAVIGGIPVPVAIRTKGVLLLEQVIRGLRTFHNRGRLLRFLTLTFVIWNTDAIGTMVLARALGLYVPYTIALLLLAGLGLASALPSTPGYVGIYQFVAVSVLTPFGISRSNAIAFILLAQGVTYLITGTLGLIGLVRYQGTRGVFALRKQAAEAGDAPTEPASIV